MFKDNSQARPQGASAAIGPVEGYDATKQPSSSGSSVDGAQERIAAPPNPFDPESLRLSQDFSQGLGLRKVLTTVLVRKPAKEWFVRVHPDESYALHTCVLELKEDRETYLVAQSLWPELSTEPTFSPRALYTAMSRQGVLFVWPIRLPGPDGKLDTWSESALLAANLAKKAWCRVTANMSLGAYEVTTASSPAPQPQWPTESLGELLKIAFRGKYIDTLDHVVLRKLRGEA